MNTSQKSKVKQWLPPIFIRCIQRIFKKNIWFEGVFDTWDKASSKCSGYDTDNILNKVLEASVQVKNKEAVYERDSVLFNEIQYSWPVIAALMWVAARNKGNLDVLDFGGALGTSYFQNRNFLTSISSVKWSVIEQPNFVQAGNRSVQDDTLKFYLTIEDCLEKNNPNLALFSSVLQYLEKPYEILEMLCKSAADVMVIDRTPFKTKGRDEVFIQKVPKSIYDASYPMWVFSREKFMNIVNKNWRLISEGETLEGSYNINSTEFSFHYLIFERIK